MVDISNNIKFRPNSLTNNIFYELNVIVTTFSGLRKPYESYTIYLLNLIFELIGRQF